MRFVMLAVATLIAAAPASGTPTAFSPLHPQPKHTRGIPYCGDNVCVPIREDLRRICHELDDPPGSKIILDKRPMCWCLCP